MILARNMSKMRMVLGCIVKMLYALAWPIWSNRIFVSMMLLMFSLCIWREWIFQIETLLHYWHFCFDIYILCLFIVILPKRCQCYFKRLCYVVAYLTTFVEIFIMEGFHVLFTPTTINLWHETTPKESREFIMTYCFGTAMWITLVLLSLAVLCHVVLNRLHLIKWMSAEPFRFLFSLSVISLLIISVGPVWGEKKLLTRFLSSPVQAEKIKPELFYSPIYRLAYSLYMLHLAEQDLGELRLSMRQIEVDSCTYKCPNIVLVIGESYNKHHAQLYGYRHQTTPNMVRMRKEKSLAVFFDAITPWNLTSKVFKNMFSTHNMNKGGKWTDGVMFPAIMRKAGYKVAFLTNQYPKRADQNGVDFCGSFFFNDAELDSMCFDFRNTACYDLDGDFIREYERYEKSEHNFVLFHLYGQHVKYDCRYDASSVYFTPDSIDRRKLNREQKQIVADYDNATLYNDKVFARICRYFEQDDAIVIYLSDHGEEVYDYIWMFGRTPGDDISAPIAYYEFDIPMMMWFSPRFKQEHSDVVAKARAAYKQPFISSNISQLILGLAGVHCRWYESYRDLLSEEYSPGCRYLKGTVAYDSIVAGTKFEKRWKRK